jgi:chromosome segregation ATPase
MNPSQSHQLQMHALREALERSARATLLAEEHTVKALSDLQAERLRTRELEKELRLLTERMTAILGENRRLRNLVGQACQDRSSLSTELRTLLQELRDGTPDDPLGVTIGAPLPKLERHEAA